MNDLIVITSYHPTLQQEDILRNLVNNILNLSKDFDIMISSHSFVPKDICDKVNYVIYDKENKILIGDEYRATLWAKVTNNYKVYTQYVGNSNTMLAAWKLGISAYSLAKSLGYIKVHKIEYDTTLNSLDELQDNNKLLDEYDTILYSSKESYPPFNIKHINGSIQSFNLSSLIPIFQSYNEEEILNYYYKKGKNIPEILRHLAEIENNNKIYYKDVDLIKGTNGITTALVHRSKDNWYVPYYDPQDKTLRFLVRKLDPNTSSPKVELIINNQYKKLELPKFKTYWSHFPLIEFEKISTLKVIINDETFYEIDFNYLNKENFKNHNYVQHI